MCRDRHKTPDYFAYRLLARGKHAASGWIRCSTGASPSPPTEQCAAGRSAVAGNNEDGQRAALPRRTTPVGMGRMCHGAPDVNGNRRSPSSVASSALSRRSHEMTSSSPPNAGLSTAGFQDADAYDRLMGRWSRRLAPLLIGFGGLADGERILDVGCGTGSLTFAFP